MEPQTKDSSSKFEAPVLGQLLQNIPFKQYAASEGINSSGLKHILRSPAHYYEYRYNRVEEKASDALIFGSLFHYAVLEPELFNKNYIVQPKYDLRTKIGNQKHNAWEEEHIKENSIIVPEKFSEQLNQMVNKMLTHSQVKRLLEKGIRETTLFWNDRETGELSKCRPDFITSFGDLIDLKTSMDAREDKFSRDIWHYQYHIQAAHYCEGGRVTGQYNSDTFIFIVIEKDPPYEIGVYPSGTSVLGVGDQWRSKAMNIYSKCKKNNRWPGYNVGFKTIELPKWAEAVDTDETHQS